MMNGYESFLGELNLTEKFVRSLSERTEDLIPMPDGYSVAVENSKIEGKGLFATSAFSVDEFICPVNLSGCRTPAGRFTNHSDNCNAIFRNEGGGISLYAAKDIGADDEITVDYRHCVKLFNERLAEHSGELNE